MTCPHSGDPNGCLSEYRRRTAALLHSWQTIPCTSCKHLRVNGELADRPKPDPPPEPQRWAKVDTSDFEDDAPKKEMRGSKTPVKEYCDKGHSEWSYRKDRNGKLRKYCKACNRARVNRQRNGGT